MPRPAGATAHERRRSRPARHARPAHAAFARVIGRFGRTPRIVTADRGYGEAGVEADLRKLKVRQVAIPRKGKPGAARQKIERAPWFRQEVKWRTAAWRRSSREQRMMSTTRVATDLVVVVEDPSGWAEVNAVPGFLAAYRGSTRVSYATDLRLFSEWCREGNLSLFSVRRAHLRHATYIVATYLAGSMR